MQNEILSNADRARWAIYTVGMMGGLYFVLALLLVAQGIKSGEQALFESEVSALDWFSTMIAGLTFLGIILSAVFFIMWFRRAYANLMRANFAIKYTEGWAAGAWFVPILNLFRPNEIAKEIWYETQELIPGKKMAGNIERADLVGWWWTFWVVASIVDRAISRIYRYSDSADSYYATAFGTMLFVPAAVLCVMFVKKVSEWETEMYEANYQSQPEDHFLANEA